MSVEDRAKRRLRCHIGSLFWLHGHLSLSLMCQSIVRKKKTRRTMFSGTAVMVSITARIKDWLEIYGKRYVLEGSSRVSLRISAISNFRCNSTSRFLFPAFSVTVSIPKSTSSLINSILRAPKPWSAQRKPNVGVLCEGTSRTSPAHMTNFRPKNDQNLVVGQS